LTVKDLYQGMSKTMMMGRVPLDTPESVKSKLSKECMSVFTAGVFEQSGKRINPSMLLVQPDGSYRYGVHYGTNPFEGHLIDAKFSLVQNVERNIGKWVSDLRSMAPRISSVRFAIGHAVECMDSLITKKEVFDVVETSNLADHVGMLNLVVPGGRLLRSPSESILKTSSFLLFNFAESRAEYLKLVTGMSPFVYATLLGVHLKEPHDQDLVSHLEPFQRNFADQCMRSLGRNYESFIWTKAAFPAVPVQLGDSLVLIAQLIKSMETTLPTYEKIDIPGAAYVTPAIIAKLLAFSYAEGRFELPLRTRLPDILLEKIYTESEALRGVSEEILSALSMYSFRGKYIEQPFKVRHVFKLPEMDVLTPVLAIFVQTGPVQHHITSLDVEVLEDNLVRISWYLPGFLKEDYAAQTYYNNVADGCAVQLYYKTVKMGLADYCPVSNWIPLGGLNLSSFPARLLLVRAHSWRKKRFWEL
jgi:hypothetical protein